MYVKKFEADTLEEALRAVKSELGPDAIILKTLTNKGIKGAFKKKKIEITAAISHKSYEKKSSVDKVLSPEQKNQFYMNRSEKISEAIDDYSHRPGNVKTKTSPQVANGYGQMGLNKVVNTLGSTKSELKELTQKTTKKLKHSLDDFLNQEEENKFDDSFDSFMNDSKESEEVRVTQSYHPEQSEDVSLNRLEKEIIHELKQELKTQENKIQILEKKLNLLNQQLPQMMPMKNEAQGIDQLKTTLKTLEIDHQFIVKLVRSALMHLSKEELENPDTVFEFALLEMSKSIYVDQALFAKVEDNKPVLTTLLSESASGQTSMCLKLAILKRDAVIVQYSTSESSQESSEFAAKIYGIEVKKAQNSTEMLGHIRRALENNSSVILDLRLNNKDSEEGKKLTEILKRSFSRVEILINLSGIHSEIYNRKIVARYKDIVNGIMISHMDLCLNFGALFNVHRSAERLPLKFFGTGSVVPDDIEAASAERIMAGLFQLG